MDEKLSTFGWIEHILLSLIFIVSGNIIVYFYNYFDKTNNSIFIIFYVLEIILGLIYTVLFYYHVGIFINNKQNNFTLKKITIEIIYVIGIILSGLTIGIIQILAYKSFSFLIVFLIYLLFYSFYLTELVAHYKKRLNSYRFLQLESVI